MIKKYVKETPTRSSASKTRDDYDKDYKYTKEIIKDYKLPIRSTLKDFNNKTLNSISQSDSKVSL